MAAEHLIDVRELAAPEPLQQILPAAGSLVAGGYLRVIHRREPHCLFPLLDASGFAHRCVSHEGSFEVFVWRRGDTTAELAIAEATGA